MRHENLNWPQREAVTQLDGPLLIIAGAGSGKTRVITYRIANMLDSGIPQQAILALTFTNKAAREMEERVRSLTKKRLASLTVSTFHAFGVSVLRGTIGRLGYRDHFSIYDQTDQIALIKETARELRMAADSIEPYKLVGVFSGIKTGRVEWSRENEEWRPLYQEYLSHLKAYNAVDFDDLITLPIRILREHPDVLLEYRDRFRYLLVDEFQDTSANQYEFMKLIADGSRNVCVVGDDDQSIYSWRGANYLNLVNFERDYPERREIKLEQNYRSSRTILAAANHLIANNRNRKTKNLFTVVGEDRPIELYFPDNEAEEASFIAEKIKTLAFREGLKYHDVGVLVRTNSLSRSLEEAFLSENIPYRVSGGESFFQRKEIKDIVSYLRLIANPDDDVSLLRVINTPRRGIGKRTLEQLATVATARHCSLYSAMAAVREAADTPVAETVRQDLADFAALVENYRTRFLSARGKLAPTLRAFVGEIDYWGWLLAEHQKNDKIAKWKFRNIELFTGSLEDWENNPDNLEPTLFNYLHRISLITRDDIDEDDDRGKVNLMTIHSAKGLEFDFVFVAGVEDGIVPHARAIEDAEENIEEERRLFYVAITRARKKLYLTSCRSRRVLRDLLEARPSPFLEEIPKELVSISEAEKAVEGEEATGAFAALRARLDRSKSRV